MTNPEESASTFVKDLRTICEAGEKIAPKIARPWRFGGVRDEPLVSWATGTFRNALEDGRLAASVQEALVTLEKEPDGERAAAMLRSETAAVAKYLEQVAELTTDDPRGSAGRQRKDARVRAMSIAKTLLDSILALLGDKLSPGFRAMLQILKEAYEVFT